MDASTFLALALACSPGVHVDTARALVSVESGFNPWAIGVVGGTLLRQPQHRAEALATAKALHAAGWNFSVGLGQINVHNFNRLGLTFDAAFDPCTNLAALQTLLVDCFDRAWARLERPDPEATADLPSDPADQASLRWALSCYYSGNFTVGFRDSYVRKVLAAAGAASRPLPRKPQKEMQ